MTTQLLAVSAIVMGAVLTVACAGPQATQLPAPAPALGTVIAQQIEQQQDGGRLAFNACVDCLKRTPKTIATQARQVRAVDSEPRISLANARVLVPAPETAQTQSATKPATAHTATVSFELNSARLTANAVAVLNTLKPFYAKAERVRITGFTDDLGDARLNTKLADARALAVMLHVRRELGLIASTAVLTAAGKPLCCYVTSNADAPSRSINRRVEIDLRVADTSPRGDPSNTP